MRLLDKVSFEPIEGGFAFGLYLLTDLTRELVVAFGTRALVIDLS